MKYNLEHFSELMEQADVLAENKDELLKESDDLQFRLTSDLTRSPSSEEVQEIVREIYDKKFGKGASEFTACCFLAWCEQYFLKTGTSVYKKRLPCLERV